MIEFASFFPLRMQPLKTLLKKADRLLPWFAPCVGSRV